MLKRILLIFLVLIAAVYPAFEVQVVRPSLIARGNIGSLHPGSLNPAANIEREGYYFGVNYSNLFGLKSLQLWNFDFSWSKNRKTAYSLYISSFGNNIYQENTYNLGYSRLFKDKISVAMKVSFYDLVIVGFDRTGALGLSFGAKFYLTGNLNATLLFQNINHPKIIEKHESLPETFSSAIQWQPTQQIEVNLEIFKDSIFPFVTRTGIKADFLKYFYIMMGAEFNPDCGTGGLGVLWKTIDIEAAIRRHDNLPDSFYFGCNISIK